MESMESYCRLYGPAQYWIWSGSDKWDRRSQRRCQRADKGSRKAMLPYCCRRRWHDERGIRWCILSWSFKSWLYSGWNRKWSVAKSAHAGKPGEVPEKAASAKTFFHDRLWCPFLWKRRTFSQTFLSQCRDRLWRCSLSGSPWLPASQPFRTYGFSQAFLSAPWDRPVF